jgi:hypothetical protein
MLCIERVEVTASATTIFGQNAIFVDMNAILSASIPFGKVSLRQTKAEIKIGME